MNAVIYSAIMYKARAATAAPLRAYTGSYYAPEPLPERDPLAQLIARPNRWQSWVEFQQLNEVYYNLAGNCYIYIERKRGQDVPAQMLTLRPDRVRIVPDTNGGIKGYFYVPEGVGENDRVPLLPQDVIHVKLPNPLDPLEGMGYGLSPVAPMARSGDVDNAVTKYLKLFFQNGAMPQGALTFSVPMNNDDVAQARRRWQEIYGGVDNWSDIAVLDNGGKYERLALSFDEMGFELIDARDESRMAMPFGVKLSLIESRPSSVQGTYNNEETDYKMFWRDTMLPEIRAFEVEYQYYLNTESSFVAYDTSRLPALFDKEKYIEHIAQAFRDGVATQNEYLEAIGLPRTDTGNIYLRPLSVVAIPANKLQIEASAAGSVTAEQEAEEDEQKALPQPRARKMLLTDEQKELVWKQFDSVARRWESRFGDAANRAFENDRRLILAIVNGAKSKAKQDKATVAWQNVLFQVEDYLRMDAGDNWRGQFAPVVEGIVQDQGEMLSATYGIEFDVTNPLMVEYLNGYLITFSKPINDTTNKAIVAMIQQAIEEGWSIPDMTDHLDQLFTQWTTGSLSPEDFEWFTERMPEYRRELIARTETIAASNAGSEELYREWGAPYKQWLATMDSRVRPDHKAANGQTVAIDAKFNVMGEELRYPGDHDASAGNVCNCRCTVIPIMDLRDAL